MEGKETTCRPGHTKKKPSSSQTLEPILPSAKWEGKGREVEPSTRMGAIPSLRRRRPSGSLLLSAEDQTTMKILTIGPSTLGSSERNNLALLIYILLYRTSFHAPRTPHAACWAHENGEARLRMHPPLCLVSCTAVWVFLLRTVVFCILFSNAIDGTVRD